MTVEQEAAQHTHGPMTHEALGMYSHLRELPVHPPEVMLYSLEATNGERTIVYVGDLPIGGPELVLMAGPCSLESRRQIYETAEAAKAAGATVFRGGAFKPRTSPYSFQGLGKEGLQMQREAADRYGLKVIGEATEESNVDIVAWYVDILQAGARNAQSFGLLVKMAKAAVRYDRTILYKRGPSMTIEEWLLGAEYLLAAGCRKVILCERGTKMSDGTVDFDDEGVRAVKQLTHLPIIGDPTHATKKAEYVPALAKRAIESGADGLLLEFHPRPWEANRMAPARYYHRL